MPFPAPLLRPVEGISPFLYLFGLLLVHVRDRRLSTSPRAAAKGPNDPAAVRRAPPDMRIVHTIEEELRDEERPRFVLDLGSGFGDRARLIAERLKCTVVAFEPNAEVSMQAAALTKSKQLSDAVWHVRCDVQLSVDAQDVIEGNLYDAVVVSNSFARRKGALAWAALALREGGVMVVEGDWKVYDVMRDDIGLELVRVCRGGTLESLEGGRRWLREKIANDDESLRSPEVSSLLDGIYNPRPYFLVCGRRTESQAPLTVRPRTMSAITFVPATARVRTNSTLFEKPAAHRLRDYQGRRLRVASVCILASNGRNQLDFGKVVIVSSSKRVGEWIIPAGGLEDGETPETAAVREASEESGAQGRVLGFLGSYEDLIKKSITQYYLVLVSEMMDDFAEKSNRRVALVDIEDAMRAVTNFGSKEALLQVKNKFGQASSRDTLL